MGGSNITREFAAFSFDRDPIPGEIWEHATGVLLATLVVIVAASSEKVCCRNYSHTTD